MLGMPGVGFEIFSETVDEGVQGPRRGIEGVSPDVFQQIAATKSKAYCCEFLKARFLI